MLGVDHWGVKLFMIFNFIGCWKVRTLGAFVYVSRCSQHGAHRFRYVCPTDSRQAVQPFNIETLPLSPALVVAPWLTRPMGELLASGGLTARVSLTVRELPPNSALNPP